MQDHEYNSPPLAPNVPRQCTITARLDRIPLVADPTKEISADYGVLMPSLGIALRGLFIINPEGVLEQVCYLFPLKRFIRVQEGEGGVQRAEGDGIDYASSVVLHPKVAMFCIHTCIGMFILID